MRAIIAKTLGDPSVLEYDDAPRPSPKAGQVLVRMRFAGVNFSDTERRRAVYRLPELPWIPGHEGAGEVEGLGEGVDGSWMGARVAFWSFESTGAYAEYAAAPVRSLFRVPSDLSLDIASALPAQGLTAFGLANYATSMRPGQSALVHAAAGGVGLLLIQLLRRRGVRVFGTASSPAKLKRIEAMGATALPYDPEVGRAVERVLGKPTVDVVFDSVGRATQNLSLALLGLYGHLVFFGDASGPPRPVDPDELYARSLRVSAFGLAAHPPEDLDQARRDLMAWAAAAELSVHVDRILPLAEAAEAHRLLEGRATVGKVLLKIV